MDEMKTVEILQHMANLFCEANHLAPVLVKIRRKEAWRTHGVYRTSVDAHVVSDKERTRISRILLNNRPTIAELFGTFQHELAHHLQRALICAGGDILAGHGVDFEAALYIVREFFDTKLEADRKG